MHNSSCGRRLARNIIAAGGFADDAAFAVQRHCGVSPLRAYRIAAGYTLAEAAARLKEILRSYGRPSEGLAHQQLSRWENRKDVPTPHYLNALCVLYHTRPDRLGFGNDYSGTDAIAPTGREIVDHTPLPDPATIDLSAVGTATYLDLLEELTESAGRMLYTAAPTEYIPQRMADLARIKAYALSTGSAGIRRRLYRLFAKNAGFIAIRIIDIAGLDDCLEWFGIARRAGRLAEDVAVQAWIAGHIGTSCAWYGRFLESGLAAARGARAAGGGRPNAGAAFGCLAEASLYARMGCRRETSAAVRAADRMFAALPEAETVADGCHLTEYFLRWHQSVALAAVGARADADELRARALELPFSRRDPVGESILRLDAAASKIAVGEVDWGCRMIAEVWDGTPSEYRVGQIPRRASQILDDVGPANAAARAVRDLVECGRRGGE
ncbi:MULTISPECIES: helix-turn-helix domain-containing protein [unclassified Nocardia]|uniref:helix-turn-helix domain-containing protein n=1 Tax=unclassified Nocardia TaxID=2637762 RepID=UPI001CE3D01F|nr:MULTISPECIES: helix-turn-helix transcriptional regulator [unclassified Nocardia]